jgi:phosphoenolpyruvate synthase/pyruvate phosphate dikinase
LLKIALLRKKLKKNQIGVRIKLHTQKYSHIPMFDFDHKPYIEKNFSDELARIFNPTKELSELNEIFLNRKKDFEKILKKLKPNTELTSLLKFLKENVYLRDYRDMIRQKLNLRLKTFYLEIGKRLDLTIEEVAALTNKEIIECLKNNTTFPKHEIKKRKQAYLLIQKGSQYEIWSGSKAIALAKKEIKSQKISNTKSLKGITGNSGKAKGLARIVYTNKDLHKVRTGDILVTTMTRQDFIIALRKAAAVVTDEGSVTAHSAIIARELKKPCVVGTEIATKVLKDGDLVEVDATKGIVKKI